MKRAINLYLNKSIVLHFIRRATKEHPEWVLGKKGLQKSIYFFNLERGRFSFRWADYGPLSDEIQQIVRDLEAVGKIEVTKVETKKAGAFLRRMNAQKRPDFKLSPELDAALSKTMRFVAERTSRNLELLASVHFWAKKRHEGDTVEYVYEMLEVLKPDAGFTKEDVTYAVNELKDCGLLP